MAKKKGKPKQDGPGRPTLFTPELGEAIVEAVGRGSTIEIAARLASIHPSTVYDWRDANPEFAEALTRAKAILEQKRLRSIERAGLVDPKNWQATKWLMEVSNPKKYAPRVYTHVEEELTDAVARLKRALADQPAALELALAALSEGDSGEGTGGPEGGEAG